MTATSDADPIIALIAEEDRLRTLAVTARAKADDAWFALFDHHDIDREDDERTRPLYAEAERLEEAADRLYDRIELARATTIEGAIAQLEFLIEDPADAVAIVVASLRALAAGGAA